ncbi:MAG: sensor histidine kinase [Xenococcaceae cyanobacterium MO_207.B15]|nr:sensor histidine kinase [Xenococcaceae cyanobacterium MO_207.B15]
MSKLVWKQHPFRLLLYLEWILLGIALLTVFSFLLPSRPFPGALHHQELKFLFDLGALFTVAALGIMGYKIPFNNPLLAKIYISICLVLSWLSVLLGGKGDRLFTPLLLIVVIRACVLFPGKERIITAALAYISFIAVKIMSWWHIRPLGIPLGRPLPRLLRHLSEEEVRGILWGFLLNSALLFGLVLAFVMLLVGAVLAEYESKQKLILANSRLRQYALKIENQATLEERNRIAREIHDSVGHSLTAQSIQLENVACFFSENPAKAEEHLVKARQLGREALQNVRQSVATLRQKLLQERSPKASLEQLIQEFQSTTEIQVNYDIDPLSTISGEIITAIYRLVQEALTNIARYSQANQVNIYLEEKAEKLFLTIEDNGVGFEPLANTTGFGLQGMRERIEALDGNFNLISKPGAGCKIQVEIKLLL